MKKFAIIIVNYNCSKDTIETINSLNQFDSEIMDIFLVDNHSTKNDLENIKKNQYKFRHKVKLMIAKKNLGFAAGNNIAIKKILNVGNYKYIFLLNPDTLIEDKNFFKIIEQEMTKTDADIIGPLVKYFPEKHKIYFAGGTVNRFTGHTRLVAKGTNDEDQPRNNLECDFVSGCAMIIKKSVFDQIGLLPENYFLYFEETDFCMKAKLANCKIVMTPMTFIYHKISSSVSYLSETYIYYMIRNQKIFSKKFINRSRLPFFWIYYIFYWCLGYSFLCIKNHQISKIPFIYRGVFQ